VTVETHIDSIMGLPKGKVAQGAPLSISSQLASNRLSINSPRIFHIWCKSLLPCFSAT